MLFCLPCGSIKVWLLVQKKFIFQPKQEEDLFFPVAMGGYAQVTTWSNCRNYPQTEKNPLDGGGSEVEGIETNVEYKKVNRQHSLDGENSAVVLRSGLLSICVSPYNLDLRGLKTDIHLAICQLNQ